MTNNVLYIGPAGWSYKDWEGIVYPIKKNKGFNHLRFMSQYFNTVEINSSFYRPPSETTTQKWVKLVENNPLFLFTYKLWQKFTHDIHTHTTTGDESIVKSGLDQLRNANRLGATLIQFPWSFKYSNENLKRLKDILVRFVDYYPVVEIRHESWNNEVFYDFLNENNTGLANIDQPVIGKSIKLSSLLTGETGYLRMHGRNYDNWFKDNLKSPAARYDYLYDDNELGNITNRIRDLIEKNPKSFIIFNNHYKGQAVANALQTMFILTKKKVKVPPMLHDHYAVLKDISDTKEQGQIRLL